jgi:hypothetical protein
MSQYIKVPKLLIIGMGRSGKDTAGEWFGKHTILRYAGSSSNNVCPLIAKELGISEKEAWETRHENRMFWYNFANGLRKDDPNALTRLCLEKGDLVIGLRDKFEVESAQRDGYVDLTIWIERDVPKDPTVTFDKSAADIIIENNGTLGQFYDKLESLAFCLGVLREY